MAIIAGVCIVIGIITRILGMGSDTIDIPTSPPTRRSDIALPRDLKAET